MGDDYGLVGRLKKKRQPSVPLCCLNEKGWRASCWGPPAPPYSVVAPPGSDGVARHAEECPSNPQPGDRAQLGALRRAP